MYDTFLLNHTPTTEHQVTLMENGQAQIVQQTNFALDAVTCKMLVWFLQAVKVEPEVRHTFTEEYWILEYDPEHGEGNVEAFRLIRRPSGRTISMARSTAFKLLNALMGKTEGLVRA